MCTLVSRVHMTFYIFIEGHTVPGNQGTHDKLNQIKLQKKTKKQFLMKLKTYDLKFLQRVFTAPNHLVL